MVIYIPWYCPDDVELDQRPGTWGPCFATEQLAQDWIRTCAPFRRGQFGADVDGWNVWREHLLHELPEPSPLDEDH